MYGFTQCMPFASLYSAFLPVLVDTSVKACVIFLMAGSTAIMLQRSSATMRYLVWGVAFLGFLLLPVLSSTVPKWRVLPGWLGAGQRDSRSEGFAMRPAPRPVSADKPDERPQDTSRQPETLESDSTRPSPERPVMTGRSRDLLPSSRLVLVVWSIGLGLLLSRIVCSQFILRHMLTSAVPVRDGRIGDEIGRSCRQLGIRRRVDVYLSSRRGTPMTWGLLSAYLLLPADARSWGPRRLRSVVLHELAHVKHRDTIIHVLTQLICAIYWFHPLVWLASRRMQVERERACDDSVLRGGIRASDYAEDLLSILVQRATPRAALAIVRRSELEGRVRAILDEKVSRGPMTTATLVLALVVGVTSTTALAMLEAPGQTPSGSPAPRSANSEAPASQPRQQPVSTVNMVCLDADDKPVPGAEVHLYQNTGGDDGHFLHSGTFTTDAEGKAVCPEAIFTNAIGNFDRWIYARVAGRLVGAARSAKWTNRRVINPEFRVKLRPSRSVEGQVTVPAGFDPTKVVVRVRTLHIFTGQGVFDYESFSREDVFPGLDTALPEIFECRPNPDGRIRLVDVPVRGRLYLVTAGAGLGEAQWMNADKAFDRPIRLTIEDESFVSGRVLSPDGKPAVGMKVTARLSSFGRWQNPYLSSFRAVTDGDGKFAIHGLPRTEFVLSIQDPKKLWTFRPLENLLVDPHKDPSLTLTMETGTPVSGRVLDREGKPVEGASFSAIAESRDGPGLAHDFTADDGRYQFRLPAGVARLYFDSLPEGFTYPDPQLVKLLDIKPGQADIQNLDFILARRSDRGL
jgi:beta-lactamase regulating signal transducer with metallopeptidase domain